MFTESRASRILLAHDPLLRVSTLVSSLSKLPASVEVVNDGRVCLQKAQRSTARGCPYDVILLSVNLPSLDGLSTALLLRENECARAIISFEAEENYLIAEDSRNVGCNLHCSLDAVEQNIRALPQMQFADVSL